MVDTLVEPPGPPSFSLLMQRVKSAAEELSSALRSVLDEIPLAVPTPKDLASTIRINRALASRMLGALRLADPLAAVNQMPRSEGLRMFLNAAKSVSDRERVARATAALRGFEELIQGEFGGWNGLEQAIGEWLPDAREKLEMASKQGAFRCASNLRGFQADVIVDMCLIHPGADGDRCDSGWIGGQAGLRRLRPGARICVGMVGCTPGGVPASPFATDLAAEGVGDGSHGPYPLLREFCSQPVPECHVVEGNNELLYMLAGHDIRPEASVDLYMSDLLKGPFPRWATDANTFAGPRILPWVPAKLLVGDVLVHEDVWPDAVPELRIYDTTRAGYVRVGDPVREVDRMDWGETIQYVGKGISRVRSPEIERLAEMTEWVCQRVGWDPRRFRHYRFRVRYPVCGAQYCLLFRPPPAPLA